MRTHHAAAIVIILLPLSTVLASCVQSGDVPPEPDIEELQYADPIKQCDDACEATEKAWTTFCGSLPQSIRRLCHEERSQGAGNCAAECSRRKCTDGCDAFDKRWGTYCDERIPGQYTLNCNIKRVLGMDACDIVYRRRSLDSKDDAGTAPGCTSSQSEN
jgi:hypothetical protein